MGDTQLFHKTRRKNSTGECTSENRREFGIETTDTHVLELEVGCNDGRRRGPVTKNS